VENATHQFDVFGSPAVRDVLGRFLRSEPVADKISLAPIPFQWARARGSPAIAAEHLWDSLYTATETMWSSFRGPANVPQLHPPSVLYYEAIPACDQHCPMCITLPYWQAQRVMLSRAQIRERLLEPAARLGISRLLISGGEPTLRRDLIDVLEDARALGFKIRLATNLLHVTEDRMDALLQCLAGGDHLIQVSFDSIDPEEMSEIRGGDYYETVAANCRRLVRLRAGTRAGTVLTAAITIQEANAASVPATIRFVLDGLGFDRVLVSLRHDYTTITHENFRRQTRPAYTERIGSALIAASLQVHAIARQDARVQIVGSLQDWVDFLTDPARIERACAASRLLFVDVRGNLRGCMYGENYASVLEQDLADILASRAYTDALQLQHDCRICLLHCN
jgi:molybdenum cofactor biosynthesis enzyme MoaA